MIRLCIFFFIIQVSAVFAQENNLKFSLEGQGIVTTKTDVPFWFRSNQFGSVPLEGISNAYIARVDRRFDTIGRKFAWAGALEVRANIGKRLEADIIEAYGKLKYNALQLQIGRSKDIMGFVGDSSLSSGAFSISGNALGIPKLEISIPEFYTLPILDNLISIKGSISLGYIGKLDIRDSLGKRRDNQQIIVANIERAKTYYHQKSLYGMLGKPSWKLKFYGGLNHQVFWGDERRIFADENFDLNGIESFFHVMTGKVAKSLESKLGNQIGSIDFGLSYEFDNVDVILYRQNFYDIGALWHLANLRDGLNGISIANKSQSSNKISWSKLLLEFLYTKNQAGMLWSPKTPSGDEDYYNNYVYLQGYSYKGRGLGTPFITRKDDSRTGLPSHPSDYFINNRVMAFHLGANIKTFGWNCILKTSYSRNFGTFGTSIEGRSLGDVRTTYNYGIFEEVGQFSGLVEATKLFGKSLTLGGMLAIDNGGLLSNSSGFLLKVKKNF